MENSKYLIFVEKKYEKKYKTKTKIFEVRNLYDELLGFIKWYAPWRKYCFIIYGLLPSKLVFDTDCLKDIQNFIDGLMAERKTVKRMGGGIILC